MFNCICCFGLTFSLNVGTYVLHVQLYFCKENVLTGQIIDKRTSFENIETTFLNL